MSEGTLVGHSGNAPQKKLSITLTAPNAPSNFNGNLLNHVSHIEIFRNIFVKTLTINLHMMDTIDIQKNFLLKGYEKVEVIFSSQDHDTDVKLNMFIKNISINAINKDNSDNNRNPIITLASEEFFEDRAVISKLHKGSGSTIVGDVLKKNLLSSKSFNNNVTTTENYELYSNYRHPLDFIEYVSILDNATFYEDFDGFNYISFDKLLTVPSTIETFNFNVGSNDKFNLYTIKSHSLRTIFDYDIYKQFEYFGNTIIGMSPSEYKVQSIDKKLSDIMYNGLGSKQQLPVELETKSGIMIKSKSQANRQKRWFNIGAINNYNMSITVIGSSARKVGSIIKINNNGYDGNIDNNKILSGYWLVYGIKDTIIKNNHYGQELMIAKIVTEV